MRMLHRFIWLQHGLWLHVDDGMLLLPKSVAPLVGGVAVMFLCALGVPLSELCCWPMRDSTVSC